LHILAIVYFSKK